MRRRPYPHPPRYRASMTGAARITVVATTSVVGIGAVVGGWNLLTDPAAMGADVAWLEGSPFTDFDVPGLVLLFVIGGGMLATAVLAIARHRRTAPAAIVMAITLLGWGIVETAVIGYQGWQQFILVASFVLAPAAILLTIGMRERHRHRNCNAS